MLSAVGSGDIAHVSTPARPSSPRTSRQSAAAGRAIGSNRISPMLTRTERRLYGSVHRRIDDQRVDAERSGGTSDRPDVLRVVQPFEHGET